MNTKKILFIGAGNMGQAIIDGLIRSKTVSQDNISFYEPYVVMRDFVKNKFEIKSVETIDSTISQFNIIILAVKPQVFKSFHEDDISLKLSQYSTKSQLIVSIMAGINIAKIGEFFKNSKEIIRVMPNTPALIGKSMSAIAHSKEVSESNIATVKAIFHSIGEVELVEEKLIDAVTGLSGSGPAFVLAFIESLTQGGILSGLPKHIAEKLAIQTVAGTALMAQTGDKTVEELRHMVTSPGGTTIQGMAALEENGFRNSVIKAVYSAYTRSKELSY